MTTADAVRRVGLALPRTHERQVRGRWKLKVKQIVYVAFSRDELDMGFGFPKAERDGLIDSDPETFFRPPASDLRYQWVCAHLARLDDTEMRELVVDAWRMCVPKMLHELPELPPPAATVWGLIEQQEWAEVRPLLHQRVQWHDGEVEVRGRSRLLAHLREHPTPRPPSDVEIRDGQIVRWTRPSGSSAQVAVVRAGPSTRPETRPARPRHMVGRPSGYGPPMTTTPQEPMPDPDVVPSGDPPPIETPDPPGDPQTEPERP